MRFSFLSGASPDLRPLQPRLHDILNLLEAEHGHVVAHQFVLIGALPVGIGAAAVGIAMLLDAAALVVGQGIALVLGRQRQGGRAHGGERRAEIPRPLDPQIPISRSPDLISWGARSSYGSPSIYEPGCPPGRRSVQRARRSGESAPGIRGPGTGGVCRCIRREICRDI